MNVRSRMIFIICYKRTVSICRSNQELNVDVYIPFQDMQKPRAVDSDGSEFFVDGCQVIKVYRAVDQSFKFFIINKVFLLTSLLKILNQKRSRTLVKKRPYKFWY